MSRYIKAIVLGAGSAILGILLSLSTSGLSMERGLGLPWLFGIRGPVPTPDHVAVVGINGNTGTDLGLPALPRDWPRGIHASLIDKLVELGASVIVFDIHFSSPKDPAEDAKLVDAVRRAGRVVLFERLTGKTMPVMDVNGKLVGEVWSESLVPPFLAVAEAATALGVFPLPKIDAAVHEFWTFKESVSYEPSMPAAALQLFAQQKQPGWADGMALQAEGGGASLGADMRKLRARYSKASEPGAITSNNPLLSALEGLYRGTEHRHLNFYGPPGTIRNIRYQDIILSPGSVVPDLADTVVFVGYSDLYDPGQLDRFYTVFTRSDGVDLAGVEIAATAFANLLQEHDLKPLDNLQILGLLTAVGLLFAFAAYLLPAAIGVALCIVLWIGYAVLAQWQFGQSHWWPVIVPLLVQVPLTVFLGLFGQYRLERKRGQRISEAINYYLPENIAKEFAAGGLDPDAANDVSFGTCFATDMAGFSTIAQGMNPRDLANFLNEYFETLASALNAHDVDVTEFRADAIMCAWLGGESEGQPRARAIRAALQSREVISRFGEQHGLSINGLRVGLESGWFYVGHAGGGGHFVYSIVGDCANTASRLEGLNKYLGTQIIASGEVIAGLDDFVYRPLGLFQLKGKDTASTVFEILGERADGCKEPEWLPAYSAALGAFQANQLESARAEFAALLEAYPDDGPAAFFLARCDDGLQGDPPGAEPATPRVISMDEK